MTTWNAASSLLRHRLVEIPVTAETEPTQFRHRVLASVIGAHGNGQPLAIAWVRSRRQGPVQVLVSGFPWSTDDGDLRYEFPPGSRARSCSEQDAHALLDDLEWTQCRLAVDAASTVDQAHSDRLEDLFANSPRAMGFLVLATPVAATEANATAEAVSDQIAQLESLRSGRGTHRRQLERSEANLSYYDRWGGLGLWRLSVWSGDSAQLGHPATAGILAGSADIAESPLVLRPAGAEITSQLDWSDSVVVGPDAVTAILRPPFVELPGTRVTTRPRFDQNLEDVPELRLGTLLDASGSPAAPFGVSLGNVNRHVFISGATGAGKSETARTMLIELAQRDIPWLVIEPAKAEYAKLASWLKPDNPLVVIRPGDSSSPPAMLNPLEPSSIVVDGQRHTFPLQTHADLVQALFSASFDAEDPFPQVLASGIAGAYRSHGWNLITSLPVDPSLTPPTWPVLADLVRESLAAVDRLGYGPEVRQNVHGFIKVRVNSLRSGTPGRFFEGGFALDLDDLLQHPCVIEIEDLGDDRDKAFFIGNLIIRLVELLRLRHKFGKDQDALSHVLVIEEAHRLLRRVAEGDPAAQSVTMFANLLAEVRGYGEGVIVAEQIPAKVIPDVVKNSAVKLMHRLPAEDDRIAVGATMNLSPEQSAHVVSLQPGVVVAHSAGMDLPVLARIERVTARRQTGGSAVSPPLDGRLGGCLTNCSGARLCTLGELEQSRDLVSAAVSLWAEHVVMAMLTWDVIGRPAGFWLDQLRTADRRRATCAVALATQAACDRRYGLIREWHDPRDFLSAASGLMTPHLDGERMQGRPPHRWSIGQFRLPAIRRALTDTTTGADRETVHPRSARWQASGINLPGPTWTDQLRQLDAVVPLLPHVRPWQVAGQPPILLELAGQLGYRDGPAAARIARAVASLGLEHRWVPVRTGAEE